MDFTQLRYFQTVARVGNITRAARELYVTQPNLSKSISKLEDELGVPLFDHRKGKIVLNDYGRMFLSSVDIAFSELASGTQTIQRMYESNQHILALACNIAGYLPDILPLFSSAHPEVGIRQRDYSPQQMIEHLIDRSVSLAISCEPLSDDLIDFEILGHKKYVMAIHKDHPLSCQNSVSFSQLKEETFICDSSRFRLDPLRQVCQSHGFQPKVGYEIQSSELVYRLVESNRGVAIVPIVMSCQMIHDHPNSPVRLLAIDEPLPPVLIGVGRLKNYEPTHASELFMDFLRHRLEAEETLVREMGYEAFL